jgi:hypothetical protein
MRRTLLALVAVVSLAAVAACATSNVVPSPKVGPSQSGGIQLSRETDQSSTSKPAGVAVAAAPAAEQRAAPPAAPTNQRPLPGLDRMIIRTITLTLGVGNVQEAVRQVERIAAEQGGHVVNSQVRQDGDRTIAAMTIRVPSETANYLTAVDRLRGLAERVLDEQSQGQDVTEEFVDLEARIRNLRASEEALLQLLSRAQRVEDILGIQRELTNVRGQIEQAMGRKQSIERRTEMATITVNLREIGALSRRGWDPAGVAGDAVEALMAAIRGLGTAAIWVGVWAIVWIPAAAILWFVVRKGTALLRPAPRGPRLGSP